jgi:hypothetical protein
LLAQSHGPAVEQQQQLWQQAPVVKRQCPQCLYYRIYLYYRKCSAALYIFTAQSV